MAPTCPIDINDGNGACGSLLQVLGDHGYGMKGYCSRHGTVNIQIEPAVRRPPT